MPGPLRRLMDSVYRSFMLASSVQRLYNAQNVSNNRQHSKCSCVTSSPSEPVDK